MCCNAQALNVLGKGEIRVFSQVSQLLKNISTLGTKKLAALAAIGTIIMGTVMLGTMYLNKPAYETIYVGLQHDDVTRIGIALAEAGIAFDVNAEGTSVLVANGQTERARMLLAEKGLPNSASTGYELFDDLGSLGLTAFMQEITRVRALEGEIARTIQTVQGVKAARVHIVLAEQGNFRRAEQEPTASVVVRYDGMRAESTALSIRHLVSAAVPSLSSENVTVMDASGRLLAAGSDPLGQSVGASLGIKSSVEGQIVSSIERALTPYLGDANFRVSVQADISTDQQQVEETIFDPESRVERSVQVVRSENNSAQNNGAETLSVEQNLVNAEDPAGGGSSESERSERREETTNYELNSKRVATTSAGYKVKRLSVAVIVNRKTLAGENADISPEQINEKLEEIRGVITAAAGVSQERSDVIELSAVNFLPPEELVAVEEKGVGRLLMEQFGTIMNGLIFLVAIAMVILFAVRPILKSLSTSDTANVIDAQSDDLPALAGMSDPEPDYELADLDTTFGASPLTQLESGPDQNELIAKMKPQPADRLEMIIDLDEERAAKVLRRWVSSEVAATT